MDECLREKLASDGFVELTGVFSAATIDSFARELAGALAGDGSAESALRSDSGALYAARNVLALWPAAATIWQRPALIEPLAAILGPDFGLVRALFFDKPPSDSWALPWHKDLTIAVRDNRLPSRQFTKPTRKAGIPHVEASLTVLESMLTARIHLDVVTDANGPLKVIPGSHRSGKTVAADSAAPYVVRAAPGDVLLMRPLLVHCSSKSAPGTAQHRRILHLEFAASRQLADGYDWHDFVAARAA
jgi:ectoine hydroxylase-related dioxygenase (phytanoyl-CoA dioxygenase family)